MELSTIAEAIEAIKRGEMIIVVDDEDRENEGDLIMAAEDMTAERMAFIIRHTGGVVCMPVSNAIADRLNLPMMVEKNTSQHGTPFTQSIDAVQGVTTGISAADRAITIRTAINPQATPSDFQRPGHIFPLRASEGGILRRAGHTEASIDLCMLAGKREGAVISELMHEDGTMMRLPALIEFAKEHNMPIVTIADLIAYRRKEEVLVVREAETDLETKTGMWHLVVFKDTQNGDEHVALTFGEIEKEQPVLVRVHSECLTGDVFGSQHCDCGQQLNAAMQRIAEEGGGVVLYLRQEGRGIGLSNKIRAYELQHAGFDTVEANEKLGFATDLRDYGIGAQMLHNLGVRSIRMMTNNPRKIIGLRGHGLEVVEQVPIECELVSERQRKYLRAKKEKMGHVLRQV